MKSETKILNKQIDLRKMKEDYEKAPIDRIKQMYYYEITGAIKIIDWILRGEE